MEKYIRDRITALRIKNNVSEYKISLDPGHSKGYIQSISSGSYWLKKLAPNN